MKIKTKPFLTDSIALFWFFVGLCNVSRLIVDDDKPVNVVVYCIQAAYTRMAFAQEDVLLRGNKIASIGT